MSLSRKTTLRLRLPIKPGIQNVWDTINSLSVKDNHPTSCFHLADFSAV